MTTTITIHTEDPNVIAAVAAALGGKAPTVDVQAAAAELAAQVGAATTPKASPPAAKKAAPAKKAEPVAEAEPEDVAVDETTPDSPTVDDAVAKATELLAAGKAKDIKAALVEVGVAKVGELKGAQIQAWFDALDA